MANWAWNVQCRVLPGGVAGVHEMSPGYGGQAVIKSDAVILSARHVNAALGVNADRTAEFSRVNDHSVTNAAGTDTSGAFIVLTWGQSWD